MELFEALVCPPPELSLALAVLVSVAVRLVAPVAAVVVPVAGPQRGDAQLVVALELVRRAVLVKNITNKKYKCARLTSNNCPTYRS